MVAPKTELITPMDSKKLLSSLDVTEGDATFYCAYKTSKLDSDCDIDPRGVGAVYG